MPSLPVIEPRDVRHSKSAPDGGAFDEPIEKDPLEDAYYDYLVRLGDDSLILGQRLAEWCGHAPGLEVDLSLANLALDLIGQATHLLNKANNDNGDELAFHRDVLDYKNCWLVEQPNGDFARTIARQNIVLDLPAFALSRTGRQPRPLLSALAAKAVKEVAYHRELAPTGRRFGWATGRGERAADGRGTRMVLAVHPRTVRGLMRCGGMIARQIVPDPRGFESEYKSAVLAVLADAKLEAPADQRPSLAEGAGIHSEQLAINWR